MQVCPVMGALPWRRTRDNGLSAAAHADAAGFPFRPPGDPRRHARLVRLGAGNGIAPEVLFFVQIHPELLHGFDPQSSEKAFSCPRTWKFVSNIVHRCNGLDPAAERALFQGAVGEAAAVEFSAFLKVWRTQPRPDSAFERREGS